MPGIIDAHSHVAGGFNEGAVAVSAMTRVKDNIDPNAIGIYRALAGGVTSMNVLHGSSNPIGGGNAEGDRTGGYADIVEDVNSENPFASLKLTQSKRAVAETISTLPEKERLVVSLYYYEDLNMKEIGSILGITESRVCQIHTKAVLRLRGKLKGLVDRA